MYSRHKNIKCFVQQYATWDTPNALPTAFEIGVLQSALAFFSDFQLG